MASKKKSVLRKSPIVQAAHAQLKNIPSGYPRFLSNIKECIAQARVRASLSVNRELIELYWYIGKMIVERQEREGWGKSIVERLAVDLQREFPDMHGFSSGNIWRMRALYVSYSEQSQILAQPVRELTTANLPQAVAEIPWGHNVTLLEKLKNTNERLWYAEQTIQNGWSRNVLFHQIESGLYKRQGKAISNFPKSLPSPQSDLAQQLLKDPYSFDFLNIGTKANERDLERSLVEHLKEFLLELGVGFAYVGQQYHLEVGGQDYYLDLLFYHTRLHCYIVIDLKVSEFQPEFAGKMNFYLSAVDDILYQSNDQPSIGIILCKSKNKMIVEYALRNTSKPIGVAAYRLTKLLPKNLKGSLPTIEALKNELTKTSPEKKKDTKRKQDK
ncbi:MAG: PDDEXK nuclease domain-containing protein [Bacteroidota bacterium]|nr:PDDEXK nuclease domain-containing protein [Bacteroidota bacterium]